MGRRRSSSPPDPAQTALAEGIRAAYPRGADAVITVVEATLAALETWLTERVAALDTDVATLRRRLAADSTTRSKPPSTDVSRAGHPVSLRDRRGRRPGGRPGDRDETLAWRAAPEVLVPHRPTACAYCGQLLAADAAGPVVERAQAAELPPVTLATTEHWRLGVTCAVCRHVLTSAFLTRPSHGPS